MRKHLLISLCLIASIVQAQTYTGRVTDEKGTPLPYATVYLLQDPAIGTATNSDGIFTLQTGVSLQSQVIISFLGYEKQELTLASFAGTALHTVQLKEQPLALEETVVSAKASKQKNKRKAMAQLLYKVYNQMQYDFSDEPYRARIVSDVRMDSEGQPWGMEQMIASVVTIPRIATEGRDSVQLAGEVCKRFFDQSIRTRADSIYKDAQLTGNMRNAASAVDSGVVVHQGLWALGNVRYDFEKLMDDVRHWTVTNENEGETVLTHTEKHNFLGIFKITFKRHFIVDSDTYRIRSFSEEADAQVSILFGYKIKGLYLDMLNLLNMDNERIEKFRLRRAFAHVQLNTIYQQVNGHLYPKEKNLKADALITSTKKVDIPLNIRATQRVISVETENVRAMTEAEMTRRMKRTIVELY
ncbi:MAG: carboxypeptidase-like regulatory domain-containing protein [Paludibacteraceae bacterium]|nr:carboxypeptidase-like regulatory domain-containing protein [Paludibacteraceae bacterium]